MGRINKAKVETLKCELATLKSKNWSEQAVRILDQHERSGKPLGRDCSMQVMDYENGHWKETGMYASLESLYRFARISLEWDGRIILGVAA